MSDTSLAVTQSLVSMRSAATQQALQTVMLRQQAGADQAVVALLEQSAEQMKAALPEGQGRLVDISA
jgi:hypothetical protein